MILPSNRNVRLLALVAVLVSLIFMAGNGSYVSLQSYSRSLRSLESQTEDQQVLSYNSESIMKTAPNFPKFVPKLLVWDGMKFQIFGLKHGDTEYFETMKYSFRYVDLIPLLVNALKTNFPDRFKPGTPPFELLFTDADSPHSECVNMKCPVDQFSPILLFGSVPKDPSVFPTMKSFPNSVFLHCLYEYQVNGKEDCEWPQKVNQNVKWDDLRETIVWRGADWAFMHYDKRYQVDGPFQVNQRLGTGEWQGTDKHKIVDELLSEEMISHFGPRWRAALLSVRAEDDEVPWVDSRFVGGENGHIHSALSELGVQVSGYKIDPNEMSQYKYQVDFGGGGGTTWEGTLTKMMMPGVLLHHETPNKDWYFDLLEPWKHYIPINADLTDMRKAYETAQNNQDKAKAVSQAATELAEYILSPRYMARVYEELFVDYLGKVVKSYQPPTREVTWTEMAKKYKDYGFNLYKIGVCKGVSCKLHCRKGEESNVLVTNKDAPQRSPSNAKPAAAAAGTRGAGNQKAEIPHSDTGMGVSPRISQTIPTYDGSERNENAYTNGDDAKIGVEANGVFPPMSQHQSSTDDRKLHPKTDRGNDMGDESTPLNHEREQQDAEESFSPTGFLPTNSRISPVGRPGGGFQQGSSRQQQQSGFGESSDASFKQGESDGYGEGTNGPKQPASLGDASRSFQQGHDAGQTRPEQSWNNGALNNNDGTNALSNEYDKASFNGHQSERDESHHGQSTPRSESNEDKFSSTARNSFDESSPHQIVEPPMKRQNSFGDSSLGGQKRTFSSENDQDSLGASSFGQKTPSTSDPSGSAISHQIGRDGDPLDQSQPDPRSSSSSFHETERGNSGNLPWGKQNESSSRHHSTNGSSSHQQYGLSSGQQDGRGDDSTLGGQADSSNHHQTGSAYRENGGDDSSWRGRQPHDAQSFSEQQQQQQHQQNQGPPSFHDNGITAQESRALGSHEHNSSGQQSSGWSEFNGPSSGADDHSSGQSSGGWSSFSGPSNGGGNNNGKEGQSSRGGWPSSNGQRNDGYESGVQEPGLHSTIENRSNNPRSANYQF